MAQFFNIASTFSEDDDEEVCCQEGVHVILNTDTLNEKGDPAIFSIVVARINGGNQTYMLTLPLDKEAFEKEYPQYIVANYVAYKLCIWFDTIPGYTYFDFATLFKEVMFMYGRYSTWRAMKEAEGDAADWWKK